MRRRRTPEVVPGRIAADGSITAGSGFSVDKTGGAGLYTVVFPLNFRLVSLTTNIITAVSAGSKIEAITWTSNSVQLSAKNGSAVLADMAFSFIAAGFFV